MHKRHPQIMPISANHPHFATMQNMVLTQHLQKEQMEIEIKKQ